VVVVVVMSNLLSGDTKWYSFVPTHSSN